VPIRRRLLSVLKRRSTGLRPRHVSRPYGCPLSGAPVCHVRTRDPAHVAGVCAALLKAQKNDDRDAEEIAEAASRPTMRFVEVTSQEQLDIQIAWAILRKETTFERCYAVAV